MEETRVDLGYICIYSYHTILNTLPLLLAKCMNMSWMFKNFVVDVTFTLMGI